MHVNQNDMAELSGLVASVVLAFVKAVATGHPVMLNTVQAIDDDNAGLRSGFKPMHSCNDPAQAMQ